MATATHHAILGEHHRRLALATVRRFAGVDRDLGEELAQQALLLAWMRRGQLEDPTRLAAWVRGIARHLALDWWRARRRERVARQAGCARSDAAWANPADAVVAAESRTALARALADLPETYRRPLVLFYYGNRSTREVASALGLSANAARQRLARGRRLLRAQLDTALEPPGCLPASGVTVRRRLRGSHRRPPDGA